MVEEGDVVVCGGGLVLVPFLPVSTTAAAGTPTAITTATASVTRRRTVRRLARFLRFLRSTGVSVPLTRVTVRVGA